MIFVFGSNLAGRHGKGAALYAVKHHGAIYGEGSGRQRNSYAIPTKGHYLEPMSLDQIEVYVKEFLEYATANPDLLFNLTPIGTGLAGHSKTDMLKLFRKYPIPENVFFNKRWIQE